MSGSNQTPFGFTGEWTDANGLLYLRERYYNPALGVFPNPDPFEGIPEQPMSLNRYSYVHNNPVNFADPSGMIREIPRQYASCTTDMSLPPDCSCYTGTKHLSEWCRTGVIPPCPSVPTATATAPLTNTPRGQTPIPNTPVPTVTPTPTLPPYDTCQQKLLAVAVAVEGGAGGPGMYNALAHIGINRTKDSSFNTPTVEELIRRPNQFANGMLNGFEGSCLEDASFGDKVLNYYSDASKGVGRVGDVPKNINAALQAVTQAWSSADPTHNALWFLVASDSTPDGLKVINGEIKANARAQLDMVRYPNGCAKFWMQQFALNSRPNATPLTVGLTEQNGVVMLYSNFLETTAINPLLGWAGCNVYCTNPNDVNSCST
jgi:RHS repeat-associated protein